MILFVVVLVVMDCNNNVPKLLGENEKCIRMYYRVQGKAELV